ncbi:HipA N-terminal domain-containing protein [Flavobacterium sasangense]|uniref:HipA N-terminal domain-containing protein n=1 Tax=Flavobacterium sasangense TaxID=503361 RepID=UPI00047AC5FC|nr:HipA N-terminal domain-containing protein [Flavobacterium sasangense]
MRKAIVYVHSDRAGVLTEISPTEYYFEYDDNYKGDLVSLTMPISQKEYSYNSFPPFFDGLLPEGFMLEGLLKNTSIDPNDYFSQLLLVGDNLVGIVTVKMENEI